MLQLLGAPSQPRDITQLLNTKVYFSPLHVLIFLPRPGDICFWSRMFVTTVAAMFVNHCNMQQFAETVVAAIMEL